MRQGGEVLFDSLTKDFLSDQKVSQSKMFGSPGLKISGKVFAFLMNGNLVLKLPEKQVDALVAVKEGKQFGHIFAPGNWRPMKQWVVVTSTDRTTWVKLAQNAKDFVASHI